MTPLVFNRPLAALAAAAFGIGTTEFVILGLLPDVARDFAISAPRAGLLISGYAIGVTVGAPILAIATARLPRRNALIGLMTLFIIGNALCAMAPAYGFLMVARVVTAFCHAAFFGIGAVVASGLVPREQRAQAVALMFTGLTLANVLGVPLGTALGHAAGWRSTFWVVAGLGCIAVAALLRWLPRHIAVAEGSILREFSAITRTQVQLALLISTLCSTSLFSVLTYIAYILRDVTGFSPSQVSTALLLYGVGTTIGGLTGGRLADWRLMPALAGLLSLSILVLISFYWTSAHALPALATLLVWGIVAFAVGPPAQVRVIDQAIGAPNLASTLNQGAFNLGNAAGAWLGGLVIAAGRPWAELSWLGAGIAGLALLTVLLSAAISRRQSAPAAERVIGERIERLERCAESGQP